MLFTPTAQILASQAQQRFYDGARLDGAVETQRRVGPVRTSIAALLVRASRAIAPTTGAAATSRPLAI